MPDATNPPGGNTLAAAQVGRSAARPRANAAKGADPGGGAPAPAPATDAPAAEAAPAQPSDPLVVNEEVIARIAGVLRDGGGTSSRATSTIRVPTVPGPRPAANAQGPKGSRADIAAGGATSDAGSFGRPGGSVIEAPRGGAIDSDSPRSSAGQSRIDWAGFRSSPALAPILGVIAAILIGVGLRLRAIRLAAEGPMDAGYAGLPGALDIFADIRDGEASNDGPTGTG